MTVWFEQQGVLLLLIAFILPAAAHSEAFQTKEEMCLPLRYGSQQQCCISQTRRGIAHLRQERHHPLRWYVKALAQEMCLCVIPYIEPFHLTHCLLLVCGNKGYTQFTCHTCQPTACFQSPSPSFLPWLQVSPGSCQNFTPFSIFSLHNLFLVVHRLRSTVLVSLIILSGWDTDREMDKRKKLCKFKTSLEEISVLIFRFLQTFIKESGILFEKNLPHQFSLSITAVTPMSVTIKRLTNTGRWPA